MDTKITKRAVDQMQTNGRDVLRWDAEVKGFGVRCRTLRSEVLCTENAGRAVGSVGSQSGATDRLGPRKQHAAKRCGCLG